MFQGLASLLLLCYCTLTSHACLSPIWPLLFHEVHAHPCLCFLQGKDSYCGTFSEPGISPNREDGIFSESRGVHAAVSILDGCVAKPTSNLPPQLNGPPDETRGGASGPPQGKMQGSGPRLCTADILLQTSPCKWKQLLNQTSSASSDNELLSSRPSDSSESADSGPTTPPQPAWLYPEAKVEKQMGGNAGGLDKQSPPSFVFTKRPRPLGTACGRLRTYQRPSRVKRKQTLGQRTGATSNGEAEPLSSTPLGKAGSAGPGPSTPAQPVRLTSGTVVRTRKRKGPAIGRDGSACKVPRHSQGQTVCALMYHLRRQCLLERIMSTGLGYLDVNPVHLSKSFLRYRKWPG
jgi:hypothetical protein